MRIWLDVLTGKQLLFAEPIIRKLGGENAVLCTSRRYRELDGLARIRGIKTVRVGRHGGAGSLSKLVCSARRVEGLARTVHGFGPDLAISFQSPEAARVAFGMGIRHVGFSDSAHATAVMKLTVPYLDKLLIPWIMKKGDFARYGIPEGDILKYRAIDAGLTSQRSFSRRLRLRRGRLTVVIRTAEAHASYNEFPDSGMAAIIGQILRRLPGCAVVVMARYEDQIRFLKGRFGGRVRVLRGVADGMDVLRHADVFVGSGGTMTAEAAFLGIPTISYNGRRDYEVDAFLKGKGLVVEERDPARIPAVVERLAAAGNAAQARRAKKLLGAMRDPFPVLQKAMG